MNRLPSTSTHSLRRTASAASWLVTLAVVACSAPPAEAPEGPVAADIEAALSGGTASFDHSAWDALLRDGTHDGLVDYAIMSNRRAELDAYADRLAAVDLASLAPAELKALLINAYNALTVVAILDHPGVASIRDIDGVWTDLRWQVGGHAVTLDNLEHNMLRWFYRDPRIHFAVNCASHSCAPLPRWAFVASELEAQLEERSRSFLTDPANVQLIDGALHVSRYFDWYGTDFTEADWTPRAETIPAFIARYGSDEVRAAVEANPSIDVRFTEYDWSLNSITVPADRDEPAAEVVTAGFTLQEEDVRGLARAVAWLRDWVEGFGVLGPVVYGLAYILAIIFMLPGSALTIGAGVTFGLGLGTLTVILSATIGAGLTFLIARYLLRSRVEKWLAGREKLSAVDRAVEAQGWRVVALTRLSPAFPFNVQNYFYGLTGVPFWHYVIASFFAMLPGTLLYVYIGLAGAEVAEAAGGAASWGQTALLVAGLIATFAVVWMVTRVAKRELDKAVAEGASEANSSPEANGSDPAPA